MSIDKLKKQLAAQEANVFKTLRNLARKKTDLTNEKTAVLANLSAAGVSAEVIAKMTEIYDNRLKQIDETLKDTKF